MILRRIAPYRKAFLAGAMALLTALAAVLPAGVTLEEGMAAWIAGLLSGLGVYAVPNAPERATDWVGVRKATDERIKSPRA